MQDASCGCICPTYFGTFKCRQCLRIGTRRPEFKFSVNHEATYYVGPVNQPFSTASTEIVSQSVKYSLGPVAISHGPILVAPTGEVAPKWRPLQPEATKGTTGISLEEPEQVLTAPGVGGDKRRPQANGTPSPLPLLPGWLHFGV